MPKGSCSSCYFATTRSDGTMLCCVHSPSWQRAIGYTGSPPPAPGTHALQINWPVVRSSDWCGEGIDASSGVPFSPPTPPVVTPPIYTIASLPTPTSALQGTRAFVSNASPGQVGGTLNQGSVMIPVYCTGSAWLNG